MAIAHGSTTTGTATSSQSVITISSHVVTGTDPALIVKVATKGTGVTVSSVFWDVAGVNEQLTQLNTDINGDARSSLFYRAAPTAKTADVTINLSGNSRSVGAASTYTGVHQGAPFRTAANNSNNGTDAAPTVDIVALNTEMVVDSLCQVSAGPDTATADHTQRSNTASLGGGTDTRGASQEKASTGATETMGWTMSDADNWAIAAGALQEPTVDIDKTFTVDAIVDTMISNLQSYYKLDGTSGVVVDSHGTADGNIQGDPIRGQAGIIVNSFNFDGVGDYVENLLSVDMDDTISVSIWFKTTHSGSRHFLWSHRGSTLALNSDATTFNFFSDARFSPLSGVAPAAVNDDAWHNVIITHDGTFSSIYLDGDLLNSGTTVVLWNSVAAGIGQIARYPGVGLEEFIGNLDEVGFWKKVLTSTQVSSLWNGSSGLAYPFTGVTEVDKTFTIDSILKKSDNDKTFTVDSLIEQQNIDKTFTSDAILVSTSDKTFTIDSILKATLDKTLTVDAILKKSDIDKTFATDAFLQNQDIDKTFTTDALIEQQDNDKTLTIDAILKATTDKAFTVDAILKQSDVDKAFSVDAILVNVNDKSFTADALLKKADNDKTFTIDSILVNVKDKTFTLDAILTLIGEKTLTVDAILKATLDKTFTLDSLIQSVDNDKTFTTDAILVSGAVDKTFTVDALIQEKDKDKTFTVDSILVNVIDKTFTIDAFLRKEQEKTFTIDATLVNVIDKTFTVDAILKATFEKTFTVDAFLRDEVEKTFTVDAILVNVINKTFTADAFLRKGQEKTFTIDSILVNVIDKTFTTDALLRITQEKTFTTDAVLKVTTDKTFTVDAILVSGITEVDKTFTIDSILKKSDIDKTFTTDALLQKTDNDKVFTLDSILKKFDIDKTFTVDAIIFSSLDIKEFDLGIKQVSTNNLGIQQEKGLSLEIKQVLTEDLNV